MRVLILGGTAFLGRAVARRALDAGHDVICAARGLSGAVPDGVRFVRVDRDHPAGLSGLQGHRRAGETGLTGTYDGTGVSVPRRRFLADVAEGVGVTPQLTWVDQDFLAEHRVQPWTGERSLPMWLPQPDHAGFMARDVSPALRSGLVTRPLTATARDTLEWLRTEPDRTLHVGLTSDEETIVLQNWRERQPTS